MKEALIVAQYNRVIDKFYVTYEWVGDKNSPVFIENLSLELNKDFPFPWELVEIEHQPYRWGGLYIRKDAIFPFGFLSIVRVKIRNFWTGFKFRLVYTLRIWGVVK